MTNASPSLSTPPEDDKPAEAFLGSGPTVQADSGRVREFVHSVVGSDANADTPRERAVALYYAVRDGFRYDPYSSELTEEGLSAERTLDLGRGWCVSKAIFLAACWRAAGIPARLGFADVRNHLSTEKMRQRMKTDIFYWHGYTSAWIAGRWVKATPAFNVELCEKFGLHPLEFDGTEDSIYHPLDVSGNRHMEYLGYRGEFSEPPIADIIATFAREYPHHREDFLEREPHGDFDAEVEAETRKRQP